MAIVKFDATQGVGYVFDESDFDESQHPRDEKGQFSATSRAGTTRKETLTSMSGDKREYLVHANEKEAGKYARLQKRETKLNQKVIRVTSKKGVYIGHVVLPERLTKENPLDNWPKYHSISATRDLEHQED